MSQQCTHLDVLIGELKQAAIDAWMRTATRPDWTARGDVYRVLGTGNMDYMDDRVTRPGADGRGGGDFTSGGEYRAAESTRFKTQFETIRATIDELVAPWLDLPDPNTIATVVERCRQTTRGLSGAASTDGGVATGGGEVAYLAARVNQNLTAMSGTLIASYKAKFLGQLGRAIGGMHAISIVRGTDIAAQQALWAGASESFEDLLTMSRDAMRKIADGNRGDWRDLLAALTWICKGVGIFATGGVTTALEVGGLANRHPLGDSPSTAESRPLPARVLRRGDIRPTHRTRQTLNAHPRRRASPRGQSAGQPGEHQPGPQLVRPDTTCRVRQFRRHGARKVAAGGDLRRLHAVHRGRTRHARQGRPADI